MATQADGTKLRRTRTHKQLERKRTRDKVSQKLKRDRLKDSLHEIQTELVNAQDKIKYLQGTIQALQNGREPTRAYSTNSTEPSGNQPYSTQPKRSSLAESDSKTVPSLRLEFLVNHESSNSSHTLPASALPELLSEDSGLQIIGGDCVQRPSINQKGPSQETRSSSSINECLSRQSDDAPMYTPKTGFDQLTALTSSSLQTDGVSQPLIDCCCSREEQVRYFECFEHTVFNTLMDMHTRPAFSLAIPVTPPTVDLLFMRVPENAISKILYKFIRPNIGDLILRSAVYIIVYRILRYRFSPSLPTYNDIPEWLRPTDVQENIPHALYIDFIPFPLLRNAIVLGLIDINPIREEFDSDFLRHLSVHWSDPNSLLVIDNHFNTVLNSDFESHVCIQENWSINAAFARRYPHIAPLVTIGH